MRWEIISTQIQEDRGATNQHKWIQALVLRVYAYLLKLYPAAFRAAFVDEMTDVFAMTLREAMGTFGLLMVVWREVRDLPINIIRVRQQAVLLTSSKSVWRARQVTRWSSMIVSLVILRSLFSPLVAPETFAADSLRLSVFFVLLFLTSVSMLLAWRWEWLGGLLTIASGIGVGSFLAFYILYFHPIQISLLGIVLIGILWSLPFVTFGILFYQLSHRPARWEKLAS
jgi:hypothetical protein